MLSWIRRRLAKSDADAVATLETPKPTPAPPAAIEVPAPTPAPAPVRARVQLDIPHDKIAARAAEIWDRKGRPRGQDVQNWVEAEAELRAELADAVPEPLPRKPR